MPKVTVYVPAQDAREIAAEGTDPAEWVRALVKRALQMRKEKKQ